MRSLPLSIVLLLGVLIPSQSFGQYLGGHFAYDHVSGSSYEISLNLYLPADSSAPDSIPFLTGDGSGTTMVPPTDSSFDCDSIKRVIYTFQHTFPGSGSYTLRFSDSSFARPFINSPGIDSAYSLRSEIVIDPFTNGANRTVEFMDKPLKKVHSRNDSMGIWPILTYHPAFTNPDGDSLSFELLRPDTLPSYSIPSGVSINPKSGELRWAVPDTTGRYSFYMQVKEYQGGRLQGSTVRHFTVELKDSISRQASFQEISGFQTNGAGYSEVHVSPGQDLNLVLSYEDPQADTVGLKAVGEPFSQTPSPFFFSSGSDSSANASFSWTPDSSHVRDHPYILSFIGRSDPSCTYRYKPVMIYVDKAMTMEGYPGETPIKLFPNPASERLIAEFPKDPEGATARILNAEGKLMERFSIQGRRSEIDVRELPSGYYFLRIEGKDRSWTGRFIKD
ncbi:MAG: T9SS type A sorting domain-containing protein [Flavobacteriales bacterium]